MSYVSSGGAGSAASVFTTLGHVVPGFTLIGQSIETGNKSKLGLGVGIFIVTVGILIATVGISSTLIGSSDKKSGFSSDDIGWRGMGAANSDTVRRSDAYSWARSADKGDTFLNHGVGPEFVEQPNYLLGQEDMLRHALTKWNNLKASGALVSDWPTYWAAYKAENADDLSASMYDFGSDGFKGSAKELRSAGIGR